MRWFFACDISVYSYTAIYVIIIHSRQQLVVPIMSILYYVSNVPISFYPLSQVLVFDLELSS